MQSIAKKEKPAVSSRKFIWSLQYRDVLVHFLGTTIVDDFTRQWDRLLDKVGFYEYPYSEQAIEQAKANHFWHQVAIEIMEALQIKQKQLKALPNQFQIDQEVLAELAEDDHFSIEVTIDLGKRLLAAHKQLHPHYYR